MPGNSNFEVEHGDSGSNMGVYIALLLLVFVCVGLPLLKFNFPIFFRFNAHQENTEQFIKND